MFSKILFVAGCSYRNPSLLPMYHSLKESETWSREQLVQYQLQKLQTLLRIAYDQTPYYRKILSEGGIRPEDIRTLEDIRRIPILEKCDIIHNHDSMRNHKYRKCFYSETSGSTGEPMVFWKNEEWDSAARAAQLRGYSWYGVNPWDRNGYLWGHLYGSSFEMKTRIMDFLMNRFRLFRYDEEAVKAFTRKLERATYLEGYSSMIYEVAKVINVNQQKPIELKLVKGTSEKIYDSYQDEVTRAFGKKMVSEYGSAESSLIAFECPCGRMHVVMENVICEEIEGEAVITNLNSFSMPVIRYRLGDGIVINGEKKCPCGMQHEIIDEVCGRIGKKILGHNQSYPSLTLYYIFKSFAIKCKTTIGYQGVQTEKGKISLMLDRAISGDERVALLCECANYFGNDMSVELVPMGLVRDHSKKFQDFITSIAP